MADAVGHYPVEKAALVFILETDRGLLACIISIHRGRLNLEEMKQKFGYTK